LSDVVVRVRDHAYTTVSANDGRFWFTGLPTGSYTLVAETGTITMQREITIPANDYDIVIAAKADVGKNVKGDKRKVKGDR
jgi:hypothetical protein